MLLSKDGSPRIATGTSRRVAWLAAAIAVTLLALLVVRVVEAIAAKKVIVAAPATPSVTVTRVGISALPTTVEVNGTIAARYDMPIGVEGDGGQIAAIEVEAGDHVKKGQILARLNTSVLLPQVANLEAALEQARAESELADAEYARAERVGAAGALSVEDTQRRRSSAATAAAKVKFAAAQLAEARARLARAEVRAPADGVVLTRNVEVGQSVTAGGEPLFRLAAGGDVELRAQVSEQDLPLLAPGQDVAVELTGAPHAYLGKVRLIGAVIDPQTRLGSLRVSLPADPNLRPGAFARAAITVSRTSRSVLPQTAVLTDDQGPYVLIVDDRDRVERRPVTISGVAGAGVAVTGGLKPDDRVVALAGAFLRPGETVNPVFAAAPP